jgi:hypothetical protein
LIRSNATPSAPRAYVERLVIPTIVEPLRRDWADVQTAAHTLERAGKKADAIAVLTDFRKRLCSVEVLDPACGSGNFFYVTLEHFKRLEARLTTALKVSGKRSRHYTKTASPSTRTS